MQRLADGRQQLIQQQVPHQQLQQHRNVAEQLDVRRAYRAQQEIAR